MAFNFKNTRYSAICQVALGAICIAFGTVDRATIYKRIDRYAYENYTAFQTEGVIAIWMGAWVSLDLFFVRWKTTLIKFNISSV
jgi:hypothetical protein